MARILQTLRTFPWRNLSASLDRHTHTDSISSQDHRKIAGSGKSYLLEAGMESERPYDKGQVKKAGKPRTTDLCPWLQGAALTGRSEHSSPRLRTGRSVVRGKVFLSAEH